MNDFIDAMAECFYRGSMKKGRAFEDWKTLPWSPEKQLLYTAKLIGHCANGIRGDSIKERKNHLVAVACNANILWEHAKET